MKISIEYCMEWNYEPRARSLRDDLIEEFQGRFNEFNIQLIQSSGGVFEVMVNDHLEVFSKRRVKRFPMSSYEVIKTINDAIDERRLG
jgi:selT/selW/selH-like putative selenoprotein